MDVKQILEQHYGNYEEDGRLLSRHGRIEYITTMTYLGKYLKEGMRILEAGAGTGRYSLALADEGYQVDSVELVAHNLDILKSRIKPEHRIHAVQGNVLDLSDYQDETFDMTLILGPMYHLYTEEDRKNALREAVRVTKKGGMIFVAYCMNESVILQYGFLQNQISDYMRSGKITKDFHCVSEPEDLFVMMRTEEIYSLTEDLGVRREGLIATDGAAHYLKDLLAQMSEEVYELYVNYHLATCERQDLIGAGNHTLDILTRVE